MNEYLTKYPWLRCYDPYPEEDENPVCSLMWLPEGWVKAFGQIMCEEIDKALKKTDFYDKAYVSEAKEKYASLRLSIYPTNDEIEKIIMKYESISETVCEICGCIDSPTLNLGGWISVYCESCYNKINSDSRYKPYDEVANRNSKMPEVLKWTRYSTGGSEHFEMDISETTKKIRERYAERKANGEFDGQDDFEGDENYYGA